MKRTPNRLGARMGRMLVAAGLAATATAAAAQDTGGVGAVRGATVTAGGQPVADVAVCIVAGGRCVVSDARGEFAIRDLRPGSYRLEIIPPGQPPFTTGALEVRAGVVAVVNAVVPELTGVQQSISVTAPVFVTPEEVKNSGFLVSSADVTRSAGALQDVSRYMQSLPGAVLGTDDFRNDLIVRGGSPLENLYIVDNIEIPNINTFANFASAGGTVSILDAQLIQHATFLTGGFPASYGNRTSSVLQVTQREGSRERLGGRLTVGFAGAGGIAEGPIGRSGRGSWIVSARRSFIDLFTNDTGIGGVPVLYTLNAKAVYDLGPTDRIWALNVTGIDRIRLGLSENTDLESELSNLDIRYRGWRSAAGVNWQRTFGQRGVGLLGVTQSRARVDQRVQDLLRDGLPAPDVPLDVQLANGVTVFEEDSGETETALKYDLTAYLPVVGKLQLGANARRFALDYDSASPFGSDGPYFVEPDANPFALAERTATTQLGGYVQGSRPLGSRVDVTAGLRVDRYGYLGESRLSPRVGASVALTPSLALRGSAGVFYQQPFFLFLSAFPENAQLPPFRADHAVAGLEWKAGESLRVTVEGYEKRYSDYPVSQDVPSLSLANIGDTFAVRDILFPMVGEGVGDSRGIELFVERRSRPGVRLYGQANLSLSRTRHAGLDGVRRPGSFDYPVVANVVGGYRLSSKWEGALRVTYLAGRPFTPFDPVLSTSERRGVFDVARVNASRTADYFRADIRIDRHFVVNGQPVTVFFGAQNVTNRRNVAGIAWDRRNNVQRISEQLGLFPIAGLDWRF